MQLPYRKPGKYGQEKLDPFMTEAKHAELTHDLDQLYKIQPTAAAEVARLAELGDFSENAEYQLAKGRLRGINQRILVLENQLKHAVLIRPKKHGSTVGLGDTVTVEVNHKQKTYQILGSSETDPEKGIISHNSPIGEALIGATVGDTVTIQRGDTSITYTILAIT